MNRNVILTCTIVAISLVQTTTQQDLNQPLQSAIQTLNSAGQTFNEGFKTMEKTASALLDGGVDKFNNGVGTLANLIVNGTILQMVADTGKKAMNMGADMLNMGQQASGQEKSSPFNEVMQAIRQATVLGANVSSGGINKVGQLAKLGVEAGLDAMTRAAAGYGSTDPGLDQQAARA